MRGFVLWTTLLALLHVTATTVESIESDFMSLVDEVDVVEDEEDKDTGLRFVCAKLQSIARQLSKLVLA